MSPIEKPAGASGGPSNIVSWRERSEGSPEALRSQAFAVAREHEQEARRRALEAVSLYGGDAFTQAALATHYARQAVARMGGGHV